ncbi:MAG: DUF401 family protein [archaeon]|nr:DUF401 family protein [archaeon]
MYISNKMDLGPALIIGGIFFGISMGVNLFEASLSIVLSIKVLFLALSVTLIPILGGVMQESGLMEDLINNMDISKKAAYMFAPAAYGLFPVPGGALMSAPMVDIIDKDLDKNRKVAINIWYRHVLILLYPLSSSVIIVIGAANFENFYDGVVVMIIPCIVMIVVGYFTLLRGIGKREEKHKNDIKKVITALSPILLAPLVDFFGRYFLDLPIPEIFMFFGLCLSFLLAVFLSRKQLPDIKPIMKNDIKSISKKMRIWRFPLLIYGMKFFLEVFNNSGMTQTIALLELPVIAFLFIGFFLGYATGRVEVPSPIIFASIFGIGIMVPLFEFALIYSAIFMGYVCTPIHPCVAYSVQFNETKYKDAFKELIIPTSICFIIILIVYGISLIL